MNLFKKLNQRGFAQHLALVVVVVGVAVGGTAYLIASNADAPTPAAYTPVAPLSLNATACYNGTNTVQVVAPVVPAAATASSFFTQDSDLSTGTVAANSTNFHATQLLYANPGDVIGITLYHATTGESTARKLDVSNILTGESLNTSALAPCANTTVVPAYVGNGYSVSPITLKDTISRATATVCDLGDLCNSTVGVTVADTTSTVGQFGFSVPDKTQGFLHITTGGIQPNGSIFSPLLISPNLANGTYTGSSTLSLVGLTGKGGAVTGPTINYTIKLTN